MGVGWLAATCSPLVSLVLSWSRGRHLSVAFLLRLEWDLANSDAIQIPLDVHGLPSPAPQLPELVHQELFFQMVIQVGHLFLGLV